MTVIEMKSKFCKKVSEIRLRENISLKELSQRSGISLEMLKALERGEIPEEMMVDDAFGLARAFNCKVSELFQ